MEVRGLHGLASKVLAKLTGSVDTAQGARQDEQSKAEHVK